MRHLIDIVSESHRRVLTQEQLAKYFISPVLYKKVGSVEARLAVPGETIATVIDGEIETVNTAAADDVVVKNPGGEEYIIARDKFEKRYSGPDMNDGYEIYVATGTTYAIEWQKGAAQFKASWGEMMIINDGDMLCSITEKPDGDLYRIEAEAFEDTYEKVDSDAE